jgi:hypothetical protein
MTTMTTMTTTKKRKSVITRRRLAAVALVTLALAVCVHSSPAQKNQNLIRHFGLIFGTAYGPGDTPLYGVKVVIHPAGQKHPSWELVSDHRGEFAQRVPPGPADYVIVGQAEITVTDPTSHHAQKKRVKAEAKVHIEAEERQDVSLHLTN